MENNRMTRVNELLRREIAAYMFRVINEENFDVSAITVTRVDTSSNLRHARVFISIRDHQGERHSMLSTIRSHRNAFQQHINDTVRLKYTPQLRFSLDETIEKGDRVLNLIAQLEHEHESEFPESKPESPPPSET